MSPSTPAAPEPPHPAVAELIAGGAPAGSPPGTPPDAAAIGAFVAAHEFPLLEPGRATFAWFGEAEQVDLLRWIHAGVDRVPLVPLPGTRLWLGSVGVEDGGRFEYKLSVRRGEREEWVLDPAQPRHRRGSLRQELGVPDPRLPPSRLERAAGRTRRTHRVDRRRRARPSARRAPSGSTCPPPTCQASRCRCSSCTTGTTSSTTPISASASTTSSTRATSRRWSPPWCRAERAWRSTRAVVATHATSSTSSCPRSRRATRSPPSRRDACCSGRASARSPPSPRCSATRACSAGRC